jgi:hypothetical protein
VARDALHLEGVACESGGARGLLAVMTHVVPHLNRPARGRSGLCGGRRLGREGMSVLVPGASDEPIGGVNELDAAHRALVALDPTPQAPLLVFPACCPSPNLM